MGNKRRRNRQRGQSAEREGCFRTAEVISFRCPWTTIAEAARKTVEEEWTEQQCKQWLLDSKHVITQFHEHNVGEGVAFLMGYMTKTGAFKETENKGLLSKIWYPGKKE